jgi:hypothetical protein
MRRLIVRSKRPGGRRVRGYLLLEVVIAGVITSAAVFGLLGQLGEGRVTSTAAAREQTARGIVAREVERARQLGFTGVVAVPSAVVSDVEGGYEREVTVTTGSEVLFNTVSTNFRDVVVRVRVPVTDETFEARMRLYE